MPQYKERLVKRTDEDPHRASDDWTPLKNGHDSKLSESKIINYMDGDSTERNEKNPFINTVAKITEFQN